MDPSAIAQLQATGHTFDPTRVLARIPTRIAENDVVEPLGDEVPLLIKEEVVLLQLKPISALFTGDRKPPSFTNGPPNGEYVLLFATIEATAAGCASVMKSPPTDKEFERLYRRLKKHPDGMDKNPVFSYMQAGARLFMSFRDTSKAEFEAAVARMARSADTFSIGLTSRNYYGQLAHMFLGAPAPEISLVG